jgi:hypothetical protein
VGLFCRHNRLEQNCTICRREKAPPPRERSSSPRRSGGGSASTATRRRSGVVTRKLARATDDGYHNDLVPGVKATADAERLADALAVAADRLDFPGPYPEVADLDPQGAAELAFLLALAGPDAPERQAAVLAGDRTGVELFLEHTFKDDPSWTPNRRFARLFDRLRLPGFGRAQRYEFFVTLGASGQLDVDADALFFDVKENDPTTLAAKRALNSGDAMLLERRAAALAEATGVPIAALDRGLALWDSTAPLQSPESAADVRAALGV